MKNTIIKTELLCKSFVSDGEVNNVIKNLDLEIYEGDFTIIMGSSGSGKSTLLYSISGMDQVTTGKVFFEEQNISSLKEKKMSQLRKEKIGFVFQFHYLLNEFSVLKNVMLPGLKLNKYPVQEIKERAMQKLDILGIASLAEKNARQISGGEKQRVAIARALINDPLIIMGDEPTGNLDKKNSELVFEMFKKLAEEFNQTLLIVTHDQGFADRTHRIIEMEDGKIIR